MPPFPGDRPSQPPPARRWQTTRISSTATAETLGARLDWPELPADAIVSLTRSQALRWWQAILNRLITGLLIKPSLVKNLDLLYAELHADLKAGNGLTITVWRGRALASFRDGGGHGWTMRYMTKFLIGGAKMYFLTYRPRNSRIPAASEAIRLVEQYGKIMANGRILRGATRPD